MEPYEPLDIARPKLDRATWQALQALDARVGALHEIIRAGRVGAPAPTPAPEPTPPSSDTPAIAPWYEQPELSTFYKPELSPGHVYHVDPDQGDDTASGGPAFPLATIEEAASRIFWTGKKGAQIRLKNGARFTHNDRDGGATSVIRNEPRYRVGWETPNWVTVAPEDETGPAPVIVVSNHEGGMQARGDVLQFAGVDVYSTADPNDPHPWYGGGIGSAGKHRRDKRGYSRFHRFIGCRVFGMMGGGINHGQTTHVAVAFCEAENNAFWQPEQASGFSFWEPAWRADMEWFDFPGTHHTDVFYGNRSRRNDNKVLAVVYDSSGKKVKTTKRTDGNHRIIDLGDTGPNGRYKGRILIACEVGIENGGYGVHAYKSSNVDAVACTMIENNQRHIEPLIDGEDGRYGGYEIGAGSWRVDPAPTPMRTAENAAVALDVDSVVAFSPGAGDALVAAYAENRQYTRSSFDEHGIPVEQIGHGALNVDGSFRRTLTECSNLVGAR